MLVTASLLSVGTGKGDERAATGGALSNDRASKQRAARTSGGSSCFVGSDRNADVATSRKPTSTRSTRVDAPATRRDLDRHAVFHDLAKFIQVATPKLRVTQMPRLSPPSRLSTDASTGHQFSAKQGAVRNARPESEARPVAEIRDAPPSPDQTLAGARLCIKSQGTRVCEPVALATGLATSALPRARPDASAFGSRFETEASHDEPIAWKGARPLRLGPDAMDAKIRLDSATSYRLQLHDSVESIDIGDRDVCEALISDRELNLVGKRTGETSVKIHYTTSRVSEVYKVTVGAPRELQDEVPSSQQLRQLVAETFPGSQVAITTKGSTLVVSGAAKDRFEAVCILSFVRSLRLVPVIDQLQVQR